MENDFSVGLNWRFSECANSNNIRMVISDVLNLPEVAFHQKRQKEYTTKCVTFTVFYIFRVLEIPYVYILKKIRITMQNSYKKNKGFL